MAGFPATSFLPVGFDLLSRRLVPSVQHTARVLRWSHSTVAGSFTFADPHEDPSLRALYEPYPPGVPNASIFETEEPAQNRTLPAAVRTSRTRRISKRQATASPIVLPHIVRSNALLVRCIRQGDIAGAISLRRDLNALHTPITPNPVYAEVAYHLLDSPDQSNPHAFLEWCELVPSPPNPWSETFEMPTSLTKILHRLLEKPDDIDTLRRFTMLGARRGMAKHIAIPAISHITRYSTPEVASKLLSDFTKAAIAYTPASAIPPVILQSWNGTFIRALCLSGRVDAARQCLLALHNNKSTIAPFAYHIVAEELEALDRPEEAQQIHTLREKSGLYGFWHRAQSPGFRRTAPMPPGTVVDQLRWIRRRIDAKLGISIKDLTSFMKAYFFVGHRRALSLLRNRLVRLSSNRNWSQGLAFWGTTEMQLYRSEGKDEEVLRTFQSIFSPIGITAPLTDALGLMQPSSVPPKKRLWPSSEALAIASWSAARLAAHSKDNGLLERCYSLFLEGCNPGSNGMFELPPTMRPDAAAFQPWVGAFAWTSGPQGVIRIMGDMRQRRISPSVMTWNALAKAYVRNNEWIVAKSILKKMEASRMQRGSKLSKPTRIRLRNRLGPLRDWGFPAPDLSTYYILLRELCMTKQLSAAQELIGMLTESGYTSGDERLDSFIKYVKTTQKNPVQQ
ncbi:PPR containing protein [Ceratobasidium sp. AG-Ba]|nr:PPR containing protein [Ceratobasidium sp. AG-Ba]